MRPCHSNLSTLLKHPLAKLKRSTPWLTITLKEIAKTPLVQYEFEEIKAAIALDRDVAANVGWSALFATPGNRRRMRIIIALAFFSQWSGNGLV